VSYRRTHLDAWHEQRDILSSQRLDLLAGGRETTASNDVGYDPAKVDGQSLVGTTIERQAIGSNGCVCCAAHSREEPQEVREGAGSDNNNTIDWMSIGE